MTMVEKAQSLNDELVRLRRDIHLHPELSFQEFRTAALVADTLAEVGGFTVKTGVGRTGVVAELGDDGPIIAIRADMDALPIQEVNDATYRSGNAGVMHACGHDAHTAILLGVAQLLKQSYLEDQWQGRVRLIFQPAEEAFDENGISGATAMIDDGALENIDAVIALHVSSDQPSGEFHFQDGHSLAAVDSFEAWIYGDGGHGAYPHTGSDPLFMLRPILSNDLCHPFPAHRPASFGRRQSGQDHRWLGYQRHPRSCQYCRDITLARAGNTRPTACRAGERAEAQRTARRSV